MSILSQDSKSNPVMQLQTLSTSAQCVTPTTVIAVLFYYTLPSTSYVCVATWRHVCIIEFHVCMAAAPHVEDISECIHTYIVHTYIVHTQYILTYILQHLSIDTMGQWHQIRPVALYVDVRRYAQHQGPAERF